MYPLEHFFKDLWNSFKQIEVKLKVIVLYIHLQIAVIVGVIGTCCWGMDAFDVIFYCGLIPAIIIWGLLLRKNWKRSKD
ncbi:hypothetical protein K6119_07595 [Paracrocinitomix mangrovi]|uniref:hypothetical protein n=1 Tax=Paracrocinitomix mangrovi TaxID=2862509 RepID=UPI001C8D03CA|nr:hypothetical protein [Paracrocinitomix mangrovi]UKN03378.1 hypothetical protein K6119_07595 [Paracrocinitomix mangrovi]